jgi:hypothetical protein
MNKTKKQNRIRHVEQFVLYRNQMESTRGNYIYIYYLQYFFAKAINTILWL